MHVFRTATFLVATALSLSVSASEVLFTETSEQAEFELVLVTDSLERPSSIEFVDGEHALISGWRGDLWRVATDTGNVRPIELELSLADGGGLRTVFAHPAFASNRWLYFCHATGTKSNNQTLISRGRLAGNRVVDTTVIFAGR